MAPGLRRPRRLIEWHDRHDAERARRHHHGRMRIISQPFARVAVLGDAYHVPSSLLDQKRPLRGSGRDAHPIRAQSMAAGFCLHEPTNVRLLARGIGQAHFFSHRDRSRGRLCSTLAESLA